MLLKISKGNSEWAILDVASVDYSSNPRQVSSQDQLDNLLGVITRNGFELRDFRSKQPNGTPYKFQVATVHGNDGKTLVAVFDNPAYLCNNAGDTLERISVS